MYSNDIIRTKILTHAWKKLIKKRKKYPVKGLCCTNLRVFFLYRAKNEKERLNCIVQRDEKKCVKDIHAYPSHHRVYDLHASLIQINKYSLKKPSNFIESDK